MCTPRSSGKRDSRSSSRLLISFAPMAVLRGSGTNQLSAGSVRRQLPAVGGPVDDHAVVLGEAGMGGRREIEIAAHARKVLDAFQRAAHLRLVLAARLQRLGREV